MYLLCILNYLLNNPFFLLDFTFSLLIFALESLSGFSFPSSDCPWAVLIIVVLEYILGSHMARLPRYAYFKILPGFLCLLRITLARPLDLVREPPLRTPARPGTRPMAQRPDHLL